jgi:hypothetical protein
MAFEGLVCEYAGRTDLSEIAAEDVLEHAVFMPAEVDMVMRGIGLQITASCIVPIKPHAPVAVDTTVHLMV